MRFNCYICKAARQFALNGLKFLRYFNNIGDFNASNIFYSDKRGLFLWHMWAANLILCCSSLLCWFTSLKNVIFSDSDNNVKYVQSSDNFKDKAEHFAKWFTNKFFCDANIQLKLSPVYTNIKWDTFVTSHLTLKTSAKKTNFKHSLQGKSHSSSRISSTNLAQKRSFICWLAFDIILNSEILPMCSPKIIVLISRHSVNADAFVLRVGQSFQGKFE